MAEASPAVAARSRVADPTLAVSGQRAIEWAQAHSPVLDGYVRRILADGSFHGRRVAVVVHLEAKTAFLATVLADAGAHVVVAGSNPHTTRDDVAAALVERGIEVHSSRGSTSEQWEQDLVAVGATEPEYIIDDGAELTLRMSKHLAELYAELRGVSEETTTGVARLRSLDQAGRLPFAAMAANDAACKHLFDNRYGTGQSTIQAILALTNMRMPGKRVAVIGYGWVGRGIATYVHQMGGRATVVEVDPIRALEAHMEGHDVADAETACAGADIVVTATGGVRALTGRHFAVLAPHAVLANAGHHNLEIDVPALASVSTEVREIRPQVTRYLYGGDKPVYLTSDGALVNIAGGLGHAIEIMDLSFAVQALSCRELVVGEYPPGVHVLPEHADRAIATAKLQDLGVVLDAPAEDQHDSIDHYMGGEA
ncbi:MAG: adenosylhomocysteinase [Nocardioidaceae bacterium]